MTKMSSNHLRKNPAALLLSATFCWSLAAALDGNAFENPQSLTDVICGGRPRSACEVELDVPEEDPLFHCHQRANAVANQFANVLSKESKENRSHKDGTPEDPTDPQRVASSEGGGTGVEKLIKASELQCWPWNAGMVYICPCTVTTTGSRQTRACTRLIERPTVIYSRTIH